MDDLRHRAAPRAASAAACARASAGASERAAVAARPVVLRSYSGRLRGDPRPYRDDPQGRLSRTSPAKRRRWHFCFARGDKELRHRDRKRGSKTIQHLESRIFESPFYPGEVPPRDLCNCGEPLLRHPMGHAKTPQIPGQDLRCPHRHIVAGLGPCHCQRIPRNFYGAALGISLLGARMRPKSWANCTREARRIKTEVEKQGYLDLSGQLVEHDLRGLIAGFEHEVGDGVPLSGPGQRSHVGARRRPTCAAVGDHWA